MLKPVASVRNLIVCADQGCSKLRGCGCDHDNNLGGIGVGWAGGAVKDLPRLRTRGFSSILAFSPAFTLVHMEPDCFSWDLNSEDKVGGHRGLGLCSEVE